MGTRSTIKFYDWDDETPVASVYQQWDGYISVVGHDLANFLKGKKIINGISRQKMQEGYANGMSCLAAQFIAEKKTEIGSLYMTTPHDMQEYNYEVRYVDDEFNIKVNDFSGTPDELLKYKE